jgi:hypothetical protein
MKTDLYTKAVLTVIAVCLVWMCVNGITPVVGAQAARPEPAPVLLVDAKGDPIYGAEGFRMNLGPNPVPVVVQNEAVPVRVTNRALSVALGAIQRSSVWHPIQVQVLRDAPTQRPVP